MRSFLKALKELSAVSKRMMGIQFWPFTHTQIHLECYPATCQWFKYYYKFITLLLLPSLYLNIVFEQHHMCW